MSTPTPQDSSQQPQSESMAAYVPQKLSPEYPGESYPSAADYADAAVARPKTVYYAFCAWLTAIGLEIISLFVGMFYFDTYVNLALKEDAKISISPEEVRAVVAFTLVSVAAITCLIYFLAAYFIFKMRSGAGWARILLTVGVAISVLIFPFEAFAAPVSLVTVVKALACLVKVVGLVCVWSNESNSYFAEVKQARA